MQLATSAVEPMPSGPPSALQIDSGELNETPATPVAVVGVRRDRARRRGCRGRCRRRRCPPGSCREKIGSTPMRLRAVGDLAREVRVRGLDAGVDDPDLDPAGGREGAEPGRVPALGGVDVGVGGAARLAGVVEPVELAEQRIVGDRLRAQDQVRLGVGDERRALERAPRRRPGRRRRRRRRRSSGGCCRSAAPRPRRCGERVDGAVGGARAVLDDHRLRRRWLDAAAAGAAAQSAAARPSSTASCGPVHWWKPLSPLNDRGSLPP